MNSSLNRNDHSVTLPIEDYERMKLGLARYEFVRCLSVQQFKEMLFDRNLTDGIPFDKLVDVEMAYAKELEQKRREEEQKAMHKVRVKPAWETL